MVLSTIQNLPTKAQRKPLIFRVYLLVPIWHLCHSIPGWNYYSTDIWHFFFLKVNSEGDGEEEQKWDMREWKLNETWNSVLVTFSNWVVRNFWIGLYCNAVDDIYIHMRHEIGLWILNEIHNVCKSGPNAKGGRGPSGTKGRNNEQSHRRFGNQQDIYICYDQMKMYL